MPKITIVGLGPWETGHLTEKAVKALQGSFVIFRTIKHPAARAHARKAESVALDHLYGAAADFTELNSSVAAEVMRLAQVHQAVIYAVPGQGLAGDATVSELIRQAGDACDIDIIPGVDESSPFAARCALQLGAGAEAYSVIPAAHLEGRRIDRALPLFVTQIDSRLAAGQVKLCLSALYGDDAPGLLGIGTRLLDIKLSELDRQSGYDHKTMLCIAPRAPGEARYDLYDIVDVMDRLRGPGGCPWDREQTHETLKQYLLEETYETIEAIELDNMDELCDELGDVLLQVVFHARIAAERGDFNITDVSDAVSRKMILRHPHIFGNAKADTPEQVVANWDAIKKLEKGQNTETGMMKKIPRAMPAVLRSMKVQGRAARVGFDWNDVWGAFGKLEEEVGELKEAIEKGLGEQKMGEEFGDVLFAAVNVARFIHIHPELALNATVEKFIRRFGHVERSAADSGRMLETMNLQEMDVFWEEAKSQESPQLP